MRQAAGRRGAGKQRPAGERGPAKHISRERGTYIMNEGMTRMPEEYNGVAKADDQGRGMTRLIAAPRADD